MTAKQQRRHAAAGLKATFSVESLSFDRARCCASTDRQESDEHLRTTNFRAFIAGQIGANLPGLDVPETELPSELLRQDNLTDMPELTEPEVMRHFTRISQRNYCIDTGLLPPRQLYHEAES